MQDWQSILLIATNIVFTLSLGFYLITKAWRRARKFWAAGLRIFFPPVLELHAAAPCPPLEPGDRNHAKLACDCPASFPGKT